MPRIGLTLAALVSASAIAACGSSSSGGTTTTTNTQPASTSSSSSSGSFDKTAAQAQAQSALLTLKDLPAGWTENPSQDSQADDAAVNAQLASCLGVSASIFAKSGPDKVEVNSSDFESPNNGSSGSVSENIDIESADRIDQDFAVVNSSKLPGCLQSVYSSFLKKKFAQDPQTKQAKIGTVTATRTNIPSYGDESAGLEIKVPFTISTTKAEVDLDMIFIRVGNTAAQLLFENTFKPFDTATAASITTKAADKLSAAAG
ncbi:MAG TPA: hypothetical protein VHC43_05435 [Mycobacteriales bacterium]|nr:hypothetical protein [Mycobacteriales bacterium]